MGKKPIIKKQVSKEKRWTSLQILSLFFSAGYLCTDFIPHFGKYADILYPQWFYLSILTLICFCFTFFYRDQFQPVFSLLTKNNVVRLFSLFIIISTASLIKATNLPEGLIDLGRIVLTFFMFFFLSAFIYQLKDRFHILAKFIALILLYQSIEGLFEFFDKAGGFELKTLLSSIAAGFANKNIMAVTLLIKVPFALFILHNSKKIVWKIIAALTLIPATCLIFILNARSVYVGFGLILIIYITTRSISFFRLKKKTSLLSNTVIVSVAIILTFLFTEQILNKYSQGSRYGTVLERIKTINMNDSSGRILQWQEGLNLFKDNFILGVGEGNFKIDFLKNWGPHLIDSLVYPRRLHNDFFEVAIETGIFGGLCYLSIFIFILINCIRTAKRKNNPHARELSFLSLLTAAVYTVDAFFNFPLERSNMQVYFGLLLAINFIAYNSFNEKRVDKSNFRIPPAVWTLFIIVLLGISYINFTALRSSAFQYNYYKDKENLTQNADAVVKHFPAFPTIDFNGQSIRSIKSIYYIKEKRFQEALDVLNQGNNPSPCFLMEDLIKINIYREMGQLDNAMHYALTGSKKGPKFYPFINHAIKIALKKGDTETAISTVKDYIGRNGQYPLAWINYAELINLQTRDFNKACKTLDAGLWWNQASKKLLEKKLFYIMSIVDVQEKLNALDAYLLSNLELYPAKYRLMIMNIRKDSLQQTKFNCLKALRLKHDDYTTLEKIAVITFHEKDYRASIKHSSAIINNSKFGNGEAEYLRGLCFLELGQEEKACADFQASAQKNFYEAQKYLDQCIK